MAREVKLLNEASLGERRREMDRRMTEFRQSGEREEADDIWC